MDKKAVFVKTKEGEEAMRQRTRLVQRNLRNVLIMVDGHASVADLAKRFGDENAAHAALTELQAGGFIEEMVDVLDFTSVQPPQATEQKAEDVPVLTTQVEPAPPPPAPPAPPPPAPPAPPPPAPPPAAPPPPSPVVEQIVLSAPEYESPPPPPPRSAPPKPAALYAVGPSWSDRVKALLAGMKEKPKARTAKPRKEEYEAESPRRGPKLVIGWPLLALFVVIGIAVLPTLTLLLYPFGRHLPDVERNASAMLQDPVKVGDIGFSLLPRPHIALRNITVGNDAHLTIASVRAVPDFLSLLGSRKVFHELTFSKVVVKDAGLGRLARGAAGSAPAEIRHVYLEDLSLSAGDAHLGGISGEVKMTAAGMPESILLRNADGTLKVELQPKGEAYQFVASGSNWKMPFKPTLTFQWLDAQGELSSSRLELGKIDGKAYDGLIEGKATLGWADGAVFAGNLELKRMNAEKLLAALGSDLSADGDLSARIKLDARANDLDKLTETLHADGTFDIRRGAAKGFDLVEAARGTVRGPTRGGETKFEQLSGTVECDPQDCRLGNLRLASGLLVAGGNLGVARKGQLSGGMNVELKGSAATLRMSLAVGGTTKDPLLTPSRGR